MEWVKNFYDKQFQLYKEGLTGPNEEHEEILTKIETLASKPFRSILELGAGGGEFAITAAKKGYAVSAVELVPSRIDYMKKLKSEHNIIGELEIIEGDFYEVELQKTFDVICYIDGFGIGNDQDQRKLLKRMSGWLKLDGCILIDIYTPWYWASVAGQQMRVGNKHRKYDFDFMQCRMLDTWFDGDEAVTQSLRCYSPQDLRLLLEDSGLTLVDIKPGGAMDYKTWEYHENVNLNEAMSYMAKLKLRF
ncbi:bifunctional 2-polyprenyl-6-hydroxyphenol methylase/3-demethylubiquinol 3-O-methyltransferase UbiG [Psychrobacillus sp. OK032]|uniref:class I SAM-dependent methyltransferase n=1 Tax=Psychrobacillus sp. OK032 TaxID=1884358 RepID=UPI0008C9E848|nr:class I SAM-dependent methyltransferase [Psychrobacillus sp. OK032]SES13756.1 Methyltransferase domain-containing protein [Psychrobacillus sp. OK032]